MEEGFERARRHRTLYSKTGIGQSKYEADDGSTQVIKEDKHQNSIQILMEKAMYK